MLTEQQLQEVKNSLFAGHYNLLLGSGVSLDSSGPDNLPVMGASSLTKILCDLKGAKEGTNLSRVSLLLSDEEQSEHLTKRYSNCKPGKTVLNITNFIWKTIYSFNIDDALEAAYEENINSKQKAESLNFDSVYQQPQSRLTVPIVHLHGFVRDAIKGYVFSVSEYGRVTRKLNPWMHVLSELLASEPFIISGTSLNESDLEFYLSGRSETSPRKNRGPSILVEPYPDAVTENDCERHGLILVKATMGEFLEWLLNKLGEPPSIQQITVPANNNIFSTPPNPLDEISFFSDFRLVRPSSPNPNGELSPFFYGRPPTWGDLASHVDIAVQEESRIIAEIRSVLEGQSGNRRIICILAEAGRGKTTCMRRVAYDLCQEGKIVLSLTAKGSINLEASIACLSKIDRPFIILIDGTADQVSLARALIQNGEIKQRFTILTAERQYRRDHIDRVIGDLPVSYHSIKNWNDKSLIQLIERYRSNGLVGSAIAVSNPAKFALQLRGEPIAVSICRILNNFRPLEAIVRSLWNDSNEPARMSYLIAAIAEHCYSGGVFHAVLEAASESFELNRQISYEPPLALAYTESDDYVVPLHSAIADRVLGLVKQEKQTLLFEAFVKLAKALAPYVNRTAIIHRAPEARLAGRIFNADQVVRPLLGDYSEKFYQETHESWQWNSRYWEQRALLIFNSNIDLAIQYARHATAIESHPYPWTTLTSLLVKKMESTPQQKEVIFAEAYKLLQDIFRFEERRSWRPTPHPYVILLHTFDVFLSLGGHISLSQRTWALERISTCEKIFPRDASLQENIRKSRVQLDN
ncbi:TPA: SIR2 family protein [Pseudomonas aeruginosa]